MRNLIKIIFCLFILSSYSLSHKCGYEKFKKFKPQILDFYSTNLRFLQEDSWQPMRIVADFYDIDNDSKISAVDKKDIKDITNKTIDYFMKIINVKRLTSKIPVGTCNGDFTGTNYPDGVLADLVIGVKWDTEAGETTEGYAGACGLNPTDRRAVTGIMGFTPMIKLSSSGKTNWFQYAVQFTLHEIGHIIFMSSNYISDKDPNWLIKRTIRGVERTLIASPKVVEAARKHFNCNTLEGVELENQGGQGTAGEHWEARVMLGDFMVGEAYEEIAISEISLALMEDLGWYKTNKYTGGLFRFGKNMGCKFLSDDCIKSTDETSHYDEFCHQKEELLCTAGRHVKGICSIYGSAGETINPLFAYFKDKTLVGYTNADHCPLAQTIDTETFLWLGSCKWGKSQYDFEKIGGNSGCFVSNISLNGNSKNQYAACYEYVCDFTNSILNVALGEKTIKCPKNGGTIDVESGSHKGLLACPDYNLLCTSSPQCNDVLDCIDSKAEVLSSTFNYDYIAKRSNELTEDAETLKFDSTAKPVPVDNKPPTTQATENNQAADNSLNSLTNAIDDVLSSSKTLCLSYNIMLFYLIFFY
jgi:hypothetical protein